MKRILYTLVFIIVPTLAIAQASGGQIRREPQKKDKTTVVKKTGKDSTGNKTNSPTTSIPNNGSTTTSPQGTTPAQEIQPIPLDSLSAYNIVIGSMLSFENAQLMCQKLRDAGWSAQIYCEKSRWYRILMVGTADEPEALLYRDHARKTYPGAWIMCKQNGRTFRYE